MIIFQLRKSQFCGWIKRMGMIRGVGAKSMRINCDDYHNNVGKRDQEKRNEQELQTKQ